MLNRHPRFRLCLLAFSAFLAMAAVCVAQEEFPPGYEVRTIKAKYDFGLVSTIIEGYKELVHITAMDERHGIVTLMGMTKVIEQIESAIEKYDVPPKNFELHCLLIEASNEEVSTQIPQSLKPVIEKLKSTLVYKTYSVLDSIVLRAKEGHTAQSSGLLPSPEQTEKTAGWEAGSYKLHIQSFELNENDVPPVVELIGLELSVLGAGAPQKNAASILTGLDVPVGQQVVVGKTNMDDAGRALIVVMSATIVD